MRVQCQARSAAGPAAARCGAPLLPLPKLSRPVCRAGDSEPVEQVCFWQQAAFAFHGGAVGSAACRPCIRARIGGFRYRAGWREQSGFRFILPQTGLIARPSAGSSTAMLIALHKQNRIGPALRALMAASPEGAAY